MSIGSRIKECRENLGITQEELARALGVSKGAIGNYEANIGYPKIENITKLFELLKTDANYIFQDDLKAEAQVVFSEKEVRHIKKYRTLDGHGKKIVDYILSEEYDRCTAPAYPTPVPTITIKHSVYKVSAGFGFDLEDRDEWDEIDIPDTPESRRADFAITIKGDSMEPIYSDGDIVLVKVQSSVNIGETGIFIVNGSGFIKQYGGDRLISINSKYDDILFSEGDTIKCAGKVIGIA